MRLNVSDIVNSPEFTSSITVERKTNGGRDEYGFPVDGVSNSFSLEATVLPATEREIQLLPQGQLTGEVIKVLSDTVFITSNENDISDRFVWHGKRYKVIKVKDNTDFGFNRAFATFEEYV